MSEESELVDALRRSSDNWYSAYRKAHHDYRTFHGLYVAEKDNLDDARAEAKLWKIVAFLCFILCAFCGIGAAIATSAK
jgi:hypothetical protein